MTFSQKTDEMNIDEILDAFEYYDGEYKRDQVDAAIKKKKDIIPHLIGILEKVNADPDKYAEDQKYYAQTYALMLLGYFKEHSAHKVIVDLFSLSDDLTYILFGDIVTEDLPVILIRTCDGSVEDIKRLILNKNANEYCRSSALKSISYAVIEEFISREDAISFLKSLFTGNEAQKGSVFYGQLASCAIDLYPKELLDTLKQSFEKEIIPTDYISFDSIKRSLQSGEEESLNQLRNKFIRKSMDDMHDSMSWWACFRQKNQKISADYAVNKSLKKIGNATKKISKIKKSFWDL